MEVAHNGCLCLWGGDGPQQQPWGGSGLLRDPHSSSHIHREERKGGGDTGDQDISVCLYILCVFVSPSCFGEEVKTDRDTGGAGRKRL